MNGKLRRDTLGIAEEAAEWLDALESGSAEVNAEFVEWLRASPRHLEEFLLVTASDRACEALDSGRKVDVDALLAGATRNVVAMPPKHQASTGPRRREKWSRWRLAAGLAAGVATLALAAAWSLGIVGGWETYTADVGEQRAVELADGSLIHLNARSRVRVRLSEGRRDIRLEQGEALFKVAHDAARPFRVQAGDAVIRAVGTQFNVDRRVDDTQVAVLEGRVEITVTPAVSPSRQEKVSASVPTRAFVAQLSAGEAAHIGSGKIVRSKTNVAEVTAWRQRRLIFRNSTLGEIVAEFNRYNRTPQFIIEEDAVRTQRFGGTFDADEPESLIAFLRGSPGLTVEDAGDRLIIRLSSGGSAAP